jgi:hypothetical protein
MPLNNQNMSATKERDESLSDVATANLFNAARRRLYTPAVVEMMQQLAKENRTAAEIAVIIGSTPGCVRVKCSQFGIKLSQRGPCGNLQSSLPDCSWRRSSAAICTKRSWMPTDLHRKANERRPAHQPDLLRFWL